MRGELEEEREEEGESERERVKREMVGHPLFEKVLAAHVECLRVATPVDYLPIIDSQLAGRSSCGSSSHQTYHGNQELDHFLAQYAMILSSFKEELQNHVRVHALEAVMASWEIERSLVALTGEPLGIGTDATMSDEEETLQADSGQESSDTGQDMMGFGPLHPTESERTLMERVRKELKIELKQGFKSKIEDVREEIMRKRRAGKLPDDTTSVLKSWWEQHSKWPYPTEDDKAMLVEETGLQLKQINNWFINQRKRNWHGCSPSTTSLKPKNKR